MELNLEDVIFLRLALIGKDFDEDLLLGLTCREGDLSLHRFVIFVRDGRSLNLSWGGGLEGDLHLTITAGKSVNLDLSVPFVWVHQHGPFLEPDDAWLIVIDDCHSSLCVLAFQSFP